jgi:hypothetical protein
MLFIVLTSNFLEDAILCFERRENGQSERQAEERERIPPVLLTQKAYRSGHLTILGRLLKKKIVYRVAAINPEFFSSYFQMTQHSWK